MIIKRLAPWWGNRVKNLIVSLLVLFVCVGGALATSFNSPSKGSDNSRSAKKPEKTFDDVIRRNGERMIEEGRRIFRYDTFGDEAFWGDTLKLHQAIEGERFGGVGPGVSPATALAVGLKVDAEALPPDVLNAIRRGRVNLNDPAVTLALLDANAVVGVTGIAATRPAASRSVGIQCALCHSTVDNSVAPGIGRRLDGWPNRDLNVGAIIALAPDLSAVADLLQTDQATVRTVLNSWGPGKFDAQLFLDGKAFRPDGKSAATLLPAAFGLAGVNLHTYTGWGGVSHWNAFVANLEMHGKGTFIDPRLDDPLRFPVAARAGFGNVRNDPDLITVEAARAAVLPAVDSGAEARARQLRCAARAKPARRCSTGRRAAPPVTCRRSSPSRAGTCTPPKKSASTTSSRAARPTSATARRRWRVSSRGRRAASTTTAGSPTCAPSSITTTGS